MISDEPWGATPFTGRAKPYRDCGRDEERRNHAKPPAAEYVGRGDSVAPASAAELVSHRPIPSAPHTVPATLPAHVAIPNPTIPAGIAEVAEHRKLR